MVLVLSIEVSLYRTIRSTVGNEGVKMHLRRCLHAVSIRVSVGVIHTTSVIVKAMYIVR